jgi:membrane protease YdiL (CAAX protease family)
MTRADLRQDSSRFSRVAWAPPDVVVGLAAVALMGVVALSDVLAGHPGLMLLLLLAQFCWLLLFPLVIARRRGGIGLLSPPGGLHFVREAILGIPVGLLLALLAGVFILLVQYLVGAEFETGLADDLAGEQGGPAVMIILFVLLCVMAPLSEEVYFRGFLYTALKRRFPAGAALVIQALAWALLHGYPLPIMFTIFGMGLVLAWLFDRRRSLVAPVSAHAAVNGLILLPVLVMLGLNSHQPAADWEEARTDPSWLDEQSVTGLLESQPVEGDLRTWAIDTWGTRGSRLWKVEMAALDSASRAADGPDQALPAEVGMVEIYILRLRDPRRGVVRSSRLREGEIDDETAAWLALLEAVAYHRIEDAEHCRSSRAVVEGYLAGADLGRVRTCLTKLTEAGMCNDPAGDSLAGGRSFAEPSLIEIAREYAAYH